MHPSVILTGRVKNPVKWDKFHCLIYETETRLRSGSVKAWKRTSERVPHKVKLAAGLGRQGK
jgi:hypothetical protein